MSLEKQNIDFLIALCKKNNRAAQEELYNRFYKAMYHTAYHFVKDPMRAEDIMQEGFITAFEKLEQYQGGGTFPGWLKTIVVRKSLHELQQHKLRSLDAEEQHILLADTADEVPQEAPLAAEKKLQLALAQLPTKYQTLLKLYYLEGFDYEEIGELLDMSYANCRTSLSRAREQLKAKLQVVENFK